MEIIKMRNNRLRRRGGRVKALYKSASQSANDANGANEKQVILSEELHGGLVRYELFCETGEDAVPSYGISIESRLPYDSGSASLSDITENLTYATELMQRMIAYTVTPCELIYVTEDFICEKYSV